MFSSKATRISLRFGATEVVHEASFLLVAHEDLLLGTLTVIKVGVQPEP